MNQALKKTLFILIAASFIQGCVSNKKTVYLQDKTLEKPHKTDKDGSFASSTDSITLEPGDVLLVRIEYTPLTEPGVTGQTLNQGQVSRSHPFESSYTVDMEGKLALPNLGLVQVSGISIETAAKRIEKAAKKVYHKPVVGVFLMNFEVNVLGDVNAPGRYTFSGNTATLLDALSMAGGIAPYGDKRSIKIIRTRGGNTTVRHIDITDIESLNNETIFLRPGDTIIIKPLPSKKYSGDNSRWIVLSFSALISLVVVLLR